MVGVVTTATLLNANPKALPEGSYYPDNGCNIAPACLSCPLPLCKYDDPEWQGQNERSARDRQIVWRWGRGQRSREIAAAFDVNERTVQRVLYEHRKASR